MVAFSCGSGDEWKNGLCDLRNCKTQSCIAVGYGADPNIEGKHYFDTLGDNTTSTCGYCGNQIKMTLETSSTSTLGTVELAFDIGGLSPTRDYWKFNTDVTANSIIATVKSVPWEFSLLQNMYLRHGYKDWFTYDSFELQKLIVEDSNGNRVSMMNAPVTIGTNRVTSVTQIPMR